MGIVSWVSSKISRKSSTPKATTTKQYSSPIGPSKPSSSTQTSNSPVTVGNITFGAGGSVTSTDPITKTTTTISKPNSGGSSAQTISPRKVYLGPVQQGTTPQEEEVYRQTGKTIKPGTLKGTTVYNPNLGGISTSQTEINSQTGKPYGSVTAAPTFTQRYSNYIGEDKTYISGTLGFFGQTASGWLSSSPYSPLRYSGYDKPVGKLLSTTVEVAPYFTPIVGPALMLGSGSEKLFTPRGWGETTSISNTLEKDYNIPKYVSLPAQVGLSVGEVYFGGKGTIYNLEKGFNLPKTNIKVLGVQQEISSNQINTGVLYKVETRRLFGTQTRYGFQGTSTRFKISPINKEIILGKSLSGGLSFKPSGIKLPEGGTLIGDLKYSNVISMSGSKQTEIFKYMKTTEGLQGIRIGKEFEGSSSITFGKVGTGTENTFYSRPTKNYFVSSGGSFESGKLTEIFGTSRIVDSGKILKQGTVSYSGGVKNIIPNFKETKFFSNSQGVGTTTKNSFQDILTNEIVKTTSQASSSQLIKVKPITQVTIPSSNAVSQIKMSELETRQINIQQDLLKVGEKERLISLNFPLISQKKISGSGGRVVNFVKQPQVEKFGFGKPQVFKQTTEGSLKLITPSFTSVSPPPIGRVIPFILPPLPFGGERTGVRGKLPAKRTYSYFPSFKAIAFNILGKGTKPLSTKRFTGLEVRPIFSGSTKKSGLPNLFPQLKKNKKKGRKKK